MTRRSRSDLVPDALLLGVAAVWGASFLSAKELVSLVGLTPTLALRFIVAALALGVICLVRGEHLPRGRALVVALALGGSQAAIIGLETWGVSLTSATNAGLLISLALVMTPLVESIAARAWLPRSYFVAAVGAVAGVALLVSAGGFRTPTAGDLLVIAAAMVRALHVTASARLLRSRSDSTLGVVMIQMLVCAGLFTAGTATALPGAIVRLDAGGWFDMLFLGLFCSVFAFVAQLWAVRRTSASRASILMGTEPVWALAVGVILAAEVIGPVGVCGAALIIAASYVGQAVERRHRLGAQSGRGDSETPPTERGRFTEDLVGCSRISANP